MKNTKFIAGLAVGFLVVCGAIFFLVSGNKPNFTFESPSYGVAVEMNIPKNKFNATIDAEEYPRYPKLIIESSDKTYTITANIRNISAFTKNSTLENAKKESSFVEFKGALSGYSVGASSFGHHVVLELGQQPDNNFNILDLYIKDTDNYKNNQTDFNKPEVQALLKSIRLKASYQAPLIDYATNDKDILKVSKISTDIDGFAVTQKPSDDNKIYLSATKSSAGNLSFSAYINSLKKNLSTAIAEDYHVKAGNHVYDQDLSLGGWTIKTTAPSKDAFGDMLLFYYAEKDGVILAGSFTYHPDYKAIGDKFITEIFTNLSVNKARADKYIIY